MSASLTLDFIFDFASPNVYFAYRALPGVLERTGATLNIVPCLLGGIFKATGNRAPMVAFADIKGKMDYEMLEIRRFVARHKLDQFRMNPHFPVNSLLSMRGLIAAQMDGQARTYIDAVLAGFWEKGQKMDDPEVLASVLREAGLDADILLTAAGQPDVKEQLAANTAAAVERGVFGMPTFFAGKEMFFGKERLGQLEEALMAAR
jgi:2-hydroxychromene-2-carboxylate isomerase